ncbi:Phospholipid-transporting ATPase [Aphelenchoides besseyi]|nr:Phospholipid-transporting ATPase [Aphelenchoides besseyi]
MPLKSASSSKPNKIVQKVSPSRPLPPASIALVETTSHRINPPVSTTNGAPHRSHARSPVTVGQHNGGTHTNFSSRSTTPQISPTFVPTASTPTPTNGVESLKNQPSIQTPTKSTTFHRRHSSRWIPATAPIYERAIDLTTQSFRNPFWRTTRNAGEERVIEPNWTQSHVPRYRLSNYKKFPTNKISTSKYTWFTFLPKNLWEQFQRWANIYFCIIVGIKYLGMIPLTVILLMTAVKDGIEDWRRKRADYRLNHNTVHVWDSTKRRFRKTLWELVLVGDLVHVSSDEKLPADIVLIRSSDPEGCVFVETSNLDGENNLKQKVVNDTFDPSNLYIRVMCNPPDNRLNHISGNLIYETGETDKVSKENVILRGCQIRNTAFAEGIVIYTGKETKLMLSNGSVKYKRSSLERITNYFILFCVLLLIFLVVSGGVCSMIWLKEFGAHSKLIPFVVLFTHSPIKDGFINMGAYILVYQVYETEAKNRRRSTLRRRNSSITVAPPIVISADDDTPQISIQLQKELAAASTMSADRSAKFYFMLNMTVCNTVMVRQKQKVDDVEFGYMEDNVYNVGNSAFFVQTDGLQTATTATPHTAGLTPNSSSKQFAFAPAELLKRIGSLSKIFQRRRTIANATAVLENNNFDAESPDELALVKAADAYGFTLVSRSATDIRVRLPNTSPPFSDTIHEDEIELEILKILPFDSDRKRMSVIVKFEDQILLLCKGADEQVLPNLDPVNNDSALVEMNRQILANYGRVGLRTLCMAMRVVPEAEFNEWLETRELVEDVCEDDSNELMSETSKRIETKLQLLGVTAIEDRLQPGVAEAIDDLRRAGIQVWVLTGDKCETAINIAKSCHLFNSQLEIWTFHSLDDVRGCPSEPKYFNAVFSSDIIKLMKEGNPEIFNLIPRCAAIVCYRMTPAEKAEVVKAVKKKLKGKTLAIGDGANDVPMILSADVGIGISGREGLQAVMASDFAISRFRFLRKLLLVHGHWNYYRLSNAILYFLDKNAVFVLIMFWEQLFNGFSSGFYIDPIYSLLYPIIFTSVQPMVYSIFDQDVERDQLLRYPHLYEQGREGQLCTFKSFAINMIDSFWQSAVIFFIPYFTTPVAVIMLMFAMIHFLFFMIYTSIGSESLGTKDPPLRVAFDMMDRVQFWTSLLLTVIVALMPRSAHHPPLNQQVLAEFGSADASRRASTRTTSLIVSEFFCIVVTVCIPPIH